MSAGFADRIAVDDVTVSFSVAGYYSLDTNDLSALKAMLQRTAEEWSARTQRAVMPMAITAQPNTIRMDGYRARQA